MPLSTEVGLDLLYIVFDVDPATPPNCWPMSIVAKWLDG